MPNCAKIEVHENDPAAAMDVLTEKILALDAVDAVLVPKRQSNAVMPMPTLVADPAQLMGMDPLAPAFALNAAVMVARLTRKPSSRRLAVMLRPCEIRAFKELVKLNQGSLEEIVIVGNDCLGAMGNRDYVDYAGEDPQSATRSFFQQVLNAPPGGYEEEPPLANACRCCEQPLPEGADLAVLLFGSHWREQLVIEAQSEKGEALLNDLALPQADPPRERAAHVEELIRRRIENRDRMFAHTREVAGSLEQLSAYLSTCVNCYNCRVACPVCYCRECVFVTDLFSHDPFQYLNWTRRKGAVKLPADTLLYHLTRLAHMSAACVGCGQCSNACPNDIAVMELFRTVAHGVQAAFDYLPGRNIDQKPPMAEFREKEFEEVVGIGE